MPYTVNHYMSDDGYGGVTVAPMGGTPVNIPPGSQQIGTIQRTTRNINTGETESGPEEPLMGESIKSHFTALGMSSNDRREYFGVATYKPYCERQTLLRTNPTHMRI